MDSMLFLRDVRSVAKVNAAVLKVCSRDAASAPPAAVRTLTGPRRSLREGAGTYGRHQAQGPLGKMLEGDKPVRAVRLGLPRSDAVHALLWILALAANEDATAVLTDDINPYEAFALAGILGAPAAGRCLPGPCAPPRAAASDARRRPSPEPGPARHAP